MVAMVASVPLGESVKERLDGVQELLNEQVDDGDYVNQEEAIDHALKAWEQLNDPEFNGETNE